MRANVTEATTISEGSKLHNAISLGEVSGGNKGNVSMNTKMSNSELSDALFESLSAHKMIAKQGGDYKLDAVLVKLKQPLAGFDMTVTSTVQYILTDMKTNEPVFDQTVTEAYTAKMGDNFIGALRAKMAVEGSVKANISAMLEQLVDQMGAEASAKVALGLMGVNSAP